MSSKGINETVSSKLELPMLNREGSTIRSGITDALRLKIMDGTLLPGSRVPEEWVAREMGVSRGPVREALRELENEGLLIVNPYRGTFVQEITSDELRNVLIPIRLILESRACLVAIPKMTKIDFQNLEKIVNKMRIAATSKDKETLLTLVDLDIQYHEFLMNLSNQYHTIQIWKSILPRIRVAFYRLGLVHTNYQEITDEHQTLLEALLTKDSEIILSALEHHICTDEYRLLDRIESKQS